jgi:hypothetical protein
MQDPAGCRDRPGARARLQHVGRLAFSTFKLAVILEQIHARHTSGHTLGPGFDAIDRMVDQLLDECATALHSPTAEKGHR